jgi:predicted RNA-binding protein
MCEANAYLVKDGSEELVMEAVDTVTPEDGGLLISNIFGDQKFLKARIVSLSLVDHKVYLAAVS